MILQNPALSRKMEISTGMALYYHLISRIIERIGDHAVRIAENAQPVMDMELDKKIITELKKASTMSMEIFKQEYHLVFQCRYPGSPQGH